MQAILYCQHNEENIEGQTNKDEEMALLHEAKMTNSCIDLAEKTFGSYHVAALLCEFDYTLWLRAGDAAMKLADLHNNIFLSLPPVLHKAKDGESFATVVNASSNVEDEGKRCDEVEEVRGEGGENDNNKESEKFSLPRITCSIIEHEK